MRMPSDEEIRNSIESGLSRAEIISRYQITKNQLAGKINRLGLCGKRKIIKIPANPNSQDVKKINEKQRTKEEKWRLVLSAQSQGRGVMPAMHIISAGHMGFEKSMLVYGEVQRRVEAYD